MSQTVIPELDPNEKPGERPYEMVWAKRTEPAPPHVRFDDLRGWKMQVEGGAQATLQVSRAQTVWERPVARLRYRGDGKAASKPRIVITPPQPVALPDGADSVDMWLYGNRWDWVNPPGTPPVSVTLHLRDGDGNAHSVTVDRVRWEEWWLMHRRLPAMKFPVRLESLEIAGGWQAEWREIFLDSIRFYREDLSPLKFAPRPKRNLMLFEGQSPGANTGATQLPFPTREETILPMHFGGEFRTTVSGTPQQGFTFKYAGKDCTVTYQFDPAQGLSGIRALVNDATVGTMMDGAGVRHAVAQASSLLQRARLQREVVTAEYDDGTTLRLRLWQKSLVVDVINRTGQATELHFGQVSGVEEPRTVWIPYITYGGSHPSVLLSKAGRKWVFTSLWLDWYRSNGSEPYGAEYAGQDVARINGGVRYHPRTDGTRNPLYERVFLTVSPTFEEVLPTIANPVGLHAQQAVDRLWQESWGPSDYEKEMRRSRRLRAYGIEKLIQCNHEIAWRDGGESFTLRLRAAPKKGGDEALQRYVAHQRALGWFSGLYTNYTDFAPVNEHWTPDAVQRHSDGSWRSAWPRCWALKPLKAVEFDARLAPQIKQKYNPNSAYTDVHTAVAPWGYNDYDARVPGAGTFAQTFYAYGEILRNDSRVYGGPIFSEGTYQWLYAGLADGNYALAYNGKPLANEPLLPVFDLYQIHSKECDIGMGWTAFFCDAIPNWQAPENIDRAIDRFLLHTLAYGHIGWLVEEDFGMARTCRSYYMLQQVQARYGLKAPTRIAYWDGTKLRSVSEAVALDLPRARRQLYVEYPGGLKLWFNDHPREEWRVKVGTQEIILPPAGWVACQPNELLSYSALRGSGKVDYLRSASYTYLDGRGQWFSTAEAASNGGLAISSLGQNRLQVIRISGDGEFVVRRPYGVRGAVVKCEAFDVEGKSLSAPTMHDSGEETWVEPVKDAVRYVLHFSGKATWSVATESEATAGSKVALQTKGAAPARWQSDGGEVKGNELLVPADAPVRTWIRLRATVGGETREAWLRVIAPVQWRWKATEGDDDTRLVLLPQWHLKGLSAKNFAVVLRASEGWEVSPQRFRVDAANPPSALEAQVRSALPSGKEGTLQVALEGLPQPFTTTLRLQRVWQQPVIADLQKMVAVWGIARRGLRETPDSGGSGAVCHPDNDLQVGQVSKRGIFMHPPYVGGVGYTWAETQPIELPSAQCEFSAHIGIKDGGDPSDGVLFAVEVVDAKGNRQRIAEGVGIQGEWHPLTADLKAFAGQRIRLRLIADVGEHDNSTADWAAWGEPVIQRTLARTVTQVSGR